MSKQQIVLFDRHKMAHWRDGRSAWKFRATRRGCVHEHNKGKSREDRYVRKGLRP